MILKKHSIRDDKKRYVANKKKSATLFVSVK